MDGVGKLSPLGERTDEGHVTYDYVIDTQVVGRFEITRLQVVVTCTAKLRTGWLASRTSRSTLSSLPTVMYGLYLFLPLRVQFHFGSPTLCMRICDPLVTGNLEDLIRHGLHALCETSQQDKETHVDWYPRPL